MCMSLKKGETGRARTAKCDITVYKILRFIPVAVGVSRYATSPYKNHAYEMGKEQNLGDDKLFVQVFTEFEVERKIVSRGFHAFISAGRARAGASSRHGLQLHRFDNQLYRARIPKGSKYFLGTNGEIVSSAIVILAPVKVRTVKVAAI